MNVPAWLGSQMGSKESEGQDQDGVSYAFHCRKTYVLIIVVVEINLRLPSMLHGKKGFDRIVYAFKNVLTTPVTWLFTNLRPEGTCIFCTSAYRLLNTRQRPRQIPLRCISQLRYTVLQKSHHKSKFTCPV